MVRVDLKVSEIASLELRSGGYKRETKGGSETTAWETEEAQHGKII